MIHGWTEQHPSAIGRLNSGLPYMADGRRVPRSVRIPYKWLRNEMRERLPESTGRTPIWMIAEPNFQRRRICDWRCQTNVGNLCGGVHVTPGKTWMRVRLPADRVLLSDFDRWENVIQGQYVPENEDDAYEWDDHVRRTFRLGAFEPIPDIETGWPKSLLRNVIRSWSRVFDTANATTIQGSFERLVLWDVCALVDGPPSTQGDSAAALARRLAE